MGRYMSTFEAVSKHFQLKHLESMITDAERNAKTNNELNGWDREIALREFRIVAHVTGRQTGTTDRIVKLFNPETDIYVGQTGPCISDFKVRLHTHLGKKPDINFLNMNSQNLKGNIALFKDVGISRVWFDVGGNGLHSRMTVINCVIRAVEKARTELNPIYVIC